MEVFTSAGKSKALMVWSASQMDVSLTVGRRGRRVTTDSTKLALTAKHIWWTADAFRAWLRAQESDKSNESRTQNGYKLNTAMEHGVRGAYTAILVKQEIWKPTLIFK